MNGMKTSAAKTWKNIELISAPSINLTGLPHLWQMISATMNFDLSLLDT